MFLTQDDLRGLTGFKRPSAMIRWLADKRYPHEIGADGWPRVLRSVVERRLGANPKREPALRLA